MAVLLNNCGTLNYGTRNHAMLYGPGAFYDLTSTELLTNLSPGDKCVVAARIGDDILQFDWFAFLCEDRLRGNRVFFGVPLWSEQMEITAAKRSSRYGVLFGPSGRIRRQSVIPIDEDG